MDPDKISRWKATCSYDGTDFHGWQSQRSGKAVQDVIESALNSALHDNSRIHGAGRTDAGVHAHGQVFHFNGSWKHGEYRLRKAIQSKLPDSIQILQIDPAHDDFHARYSATGKKYIYWWSEKEPCPFRMRYCWHLPQVPNLSLIEDAMSRILGKHDFTAFAGKVKKGENPSKTIVQTRILEEKDRTGLVFVGDGFLYRMVRSLAGTLYRLGIGKITLNEWQEILDGKKRTPEVLTAPACGLFLEEVYYSEFSME